MTAPQPERFNALRADPAAIAGILRVLSNPDRLAILCHLAGGEHSVTAIGAALDLRQPALSQQLADLRDNGLVTARRESRQVHYALASPRVLQLLEGLNAGFAAATDAPAPQPAPRAPAHRFAEAAHFGRIAPGGRG